MGEPETIQKRKRKKAKGPRPKVPKGTSGRKRSPKLEGGKWNIILTLLSAFIILVGGLGVAFQREQSLSTSSGGPLERDQIISSVERDLSSDIFYLAANTLNTQDYPNLARFNILFKASMDDLVENRYDPRRMGDYRISIKDRDLEISVQPMSTLASDCVANISFSGSTGPVTLPTYYRVKGHVTLLVVNGKDGSVTLTTNMSVDRLIPNLSPYVNVRMDEFNANGLSEYTDIGRMVRYMLTTLVRYRTSFGFGSGPYDTEKDMLNEGDVELAVNIAVLLEEARLFGTYDQDAVMSVDHFYKDANNPTLHMDEPGWAPYNPTSIRPWGSAERKNYGRYMNRVGKHGFHALDDLFKTYVKEGVLDPSDLITIYTNLDHMGDAIDVDPATHPTILHDNFLLDGRYQNDRRDQSHLQYFEDIGPRELRFKDPGGTFGMDYVETLKVDQYPDYLTVGSEIKVSKEIVTPYKWMTNVRLNEGSRTGGVPPPQPPPEHDWVMLWKFRVWGEFDLAVGKDPSLSQSDGLSGHWLENRTISLDIPLSIFTPLTLRPMNNAVIFTNLNVGSPPGATYNFTKESLAYEEFSNSTWPMLKDLVGAVLGDAIRLVKGATCPYDGLLSNGNDLTTLEAKDRLNDLDMGIWTSIRDLVQDRLSGVGLSTRILKPFLNFEYFMDIDVVDGAGFDGVDYTFVMRMETQVGNITISMDVAQDSDKVPGWASAISDIMVDGLLDVDYELSWNDERTELQASGSGEIGDPWSLSDTEEGPTERVGVIVETGGGFDMMVIPDPSTGVSDPLAPIISAIPPKTEDPSDIIADLARSLRSLPGDDLVIQFSRGEGKDEWFGLEATTKDSISLLLDWIADHSHAITSLSQAGLLDAGALGMAIAEELGTQSDIYVRAYVGKAVFKVPLGYYSDASQMFQRGLIYEPLKVIATKGLSFSFDTVASIGAMVSTLTYTESSEIILTEMGW